MLAFENGGALLQSASELPDLSGVRRLFLDLETTHSDPDSPEATGLKPYHGSVIAGVAVTWDDNPVAYYAPIGHHHGAVNRKFPNLPADSVLRWLRDAFKALDGSGGAWINHNVKFDAHFLAQAGLDLSRTRMVDTLVGAKLLDSDRGYGGDPGYGLDELALDWLSEDMSHGVDAVKAYLAGVKLPRNRKCHDYGRVPVDIMAFYATNDVLRNRELHAHIEAEMPEDCAEVWRTEQALTPVLFDMERAGMGVDVRRLQLAKFKTALRLSALEERLNKKTGFPVRPHTNDDCYDLFCNFHGLPVLGWTKDPDSGEQTANPSFDKETLKSYLQHPDVVANQSIREDVETVRQYRKLHTLLTYFIEPYLTQNVGGVLHPAYKQVVRTGRMACSSPNMQQVSSEAKDFVVPGKGRSFISKDYKQVEFRVMMHYGRDPEPLLAYERDPDTDFHTWVSEMCGIPRKPSKNVNFCIGFGGGEKRVLRMLAADMDLMASLGDELDRMTAAGELRAADRRAEFSRMCAARAREVYQEYHATLPGIKRMTRVCAFRAKARGWVKTGAGRRRHLPREAVWKAFNAVVQGFAADIMKRQTVALSPRYNAWMRGIGAELAASVHDETLTRLPTEAATPEVASALVSVLEQVDFPLRVPMRASAGMSSVSWAEAGSKEAEVAVDRSAGAIGAALEAAGRALEAAGVRLKAPQGLAA